MFSKFQKALFWVVSKSTAIYETGDFVIELIKVIRSGKLSKEQLLKIKTELDEALKEWGIS